MGLSLGNLGRKASWGGCTKFQFRIKTASTTEILRKADTPEGKEGAGFSFLAFSPQS